MKIRALQALTIRDAESGELTSIPYNSVAEVDAEVGGDLIEDGLAEEYKLVEPTGTKTITENGETDVTEYASADVNVSGGGLSTAHVEFICTGEEGYQYIVDSIPMVVDGVLGVNSLLVREGYAESADIPISENGFVINTDAFEGIDTSEPIALTGNISIDEDVCIITGNGTITCKGTDGK